MHQPIGDDSVTNGGRGATSRALSQTEFAKQLHASPHIQFRHRCQPPPSAA
jgi:hypothetical protein